MLLQDCNFFKLLLQYKGATQQKQYAYTTARYLNLPHSFFTLPELRQLPFAILRRLH